MMNGGEAVAEGQWKNWTGVEPDQVTGYSGLKAD